MTQVLGAPPIWSRNTPPTAVSLTTSGIMLGIPCYGGVMTEGTTRSLEGAYRLFADLNVPLVPCFIRNESLVQRARNRIVAEFLATECDQLIFIDSDIGFHPDHLLRLASHQQDMVGGLYRKKTLEEVAFAVNFDSHEGRSERIPESGLVAARHLATGFLKIRRAVFDRMRQAMPHLRYQSHPQEGGPGEWRNNLWSFFDCWICPATGVYLSEDWGFCERWRAIGGRCWADPTMILQHFGQFGIWADPDEHFAAAAAAQLEAQPA